MKRRKAGRGRLRVISVTEEPLEVVPFVSAAPGSQGIIYGGLPIYLGEMQGLPVAVEALIVASDLQGIALSENGGYGDMLVGEKVAGTLENLLPLYLPGIRPEKVLVCLCGDLYGDTAIRGASGNPLPVWRAFRRRFGTVIGVNGNHDLLTSEGEAELAAAAGIHLFSEPGILHHHELRIAGLGGVTGRADRPNRTPEKEYLEQLEGLLQRGPDLLLLHQSPDLPGAGLPGHAGIRERLESGPEILVCSGHVHWNRPLAELADGVQLLNSDGRVLVFTPAG
ncbi:metallophosphoesterase family protein [Paenibacillus piscarius]|uniref:metallophosphoesterase family protein n=1 Tax=Paenibacillus piscarius TaxID=1089681 RepID=UPI001EE92724|nr:metallophosphoesterase [Paenibacillus piscarius]